MPRSNTAVTTRAPALAIHTIHTESNRKDGTSCALRLWILIFRKKRLEDTNGLQGPFTVGQPRRATAPIPPRSLSFYSKELPIACQANWPLLRELNLKAIYSFAWLAALLHTLNACTTGMKIIFLTDRLCLKSTCAPNTPQS
jgi:hypothetical protein